MKLRYSESDERFRKELRAWLQEAAPAGDWVARREYDTSWQCKLYAAAEHADRMASLVDRGA